jgi:hypothetical protein
VIRAVAVSVAAAAAACSIGPVDLNGKQCPCADGWTCDTVTNTCVEGPADAPASADASPGLDGPSDATPDARVDAMPGSTCLGAAGVELLADDFPDLIGWTTVSGAWAATGGEAVQSNTGAQQAYAFPAGTGAFVDYRVTVSARRTGGTGTTQTALRIQPGNEGQYNCTWNPGTGAFALQWIRTNGNFGGTLASMTIDTSGIPGYDPAAPVTIESQVVGTALSCCIREVPGAALSTDDNRYDLGSPGIKTFTAAAAFGTFRVNAP